MKQIKKKRESLTQIYWKRSALANMQKYQEALEQYYNKSVVSHLLDIGDLVLEKDICTRAKHKFLSP
jgi:hypothetical protein